MLILTEKPSVAKEFAVALGVPFKNGYYENDKYVITNCIGHLFELVGPEAYNASWGKPWSLEQLPMIPTEWHYERIPSAAKQTALVMQLFMKHSDDDILIAGDAGREGELIARIVLQEAGITDFSRAKRFWVSEALTPDVILKGIASAKPLGDYEKIAAQGFARSHADWLVGMNLTRYASLGQSGAMRVGRVQSAVAAAIMRRNDTITAFTPQPFKELDAKITSNSGAALTAKLLNPGNEKTSFTAPPDLDYISTAAAAIVGKPVDKTDTASKEKRRKPDMLLNITALQKICYKQFGYSPEKTLDIAQSLYENHKCLSYPRTPSRVMGDNNVDLFRQKFDMVKKEYSKVFQDALKVCDESLINAGNKHIFDSSKLEDHHALIPLAPLAKNANDEEKNVYQVVVKSFLTVCMSDYVYNETKFLFYVGAYKLTATVKEVINAGFTAGSKMKDSKDDDKDVDEGQEVSGFDSAHCKITDVQIIEKKTSPPNEYAIDTLLAFMENPRGDTSNNSGKLACLGTPATRADIIKKLTTPSGSTEPYIIEKGKKLYATERCRFLLEFLQSDPDLKKITDVDNTTEWEKLLEQSPDTFEKTIAEYIKSCIKKDRQVQHYIQAKDSLGNCPVCGKPIYDGKLSYYCSGYKEEPKCSFTIWKLSAGASFGISDVKLLLSGKPTKLKKCKSKAGKEFNAFFVVEAGKVEMKFEEKKKEQ